MSAAFSAYSAAESPVQILRSYEMITSRDPENYARFFIDGDTVTAEGYFKGKTVDGLYLKSGGMLTGSAETVRVYDSGKFSAKCAVSAANAGYGVLWLAFSDNTGVSYYLKHAADGWYFPNNRLYERSEKVIENAVATDSLTAALYVDETLDIETTRQTLEQIRAIANEVTAGMTDDYDKARALNAWVAANNYYDIDAHEDSVTLANSSLRYILLTKRVICTGYANMYSALLEAAGIKSLNIRGGAAYAEDSGEPGTVTYDDLLTKTMVHEWVAFWYENESRWVLTDPGWDSGNTFENGGYHFREAAQQYFDAAPLALSLSHRADRAEERRYFDSNEFLQSGGAAAFASVPETEPEAEPEPTVTATTTAKIVTESPDSEEIAAEAADNGPNLLVRIGFAFIAVLFIACATLAVNLIKNRKK